MNVSTPRVLIAEDDILVSDTIREVLAESGYTVIGEARDGWQAIELAQTLQPDVILLDLKMPEMDGLEAARQIQERCPTPIVVMTAYETQKLVVQAGAAGVGAYLVKPPRQPNIKRAITIAMARFEDMMALRRMNIELKIEISQRKQVEEQLKAALTEKEALLKEVYHRVKNNMQALVYLVDIQARAIKAPEAVDAFKELQRRVQAMGLVHQKLYQAQDLTQIGFNEYLQTMTADLFYAMANDRAIALRIEAEKIFIKANLAIPCGLMVNELVTNALKYAFPPSLEEDPSFEKAGPSSKQENEIRIVFESHEDEYVLTVSDNGVGLPPELDWRAPESMGLWLVRGWATHQLGGSLEVDSRAGTTFTIRFSDKSKAQN